MEPLPLRETERGLGFLGCGQYRIADGRQAGARSCVSGMTAVAALAGEHAGEPRTITPAAVSNVGYWGNWQGAGHYSIDCNASGREGKELLK